MALSKPTGKLAFAYQSIAILEAARKQDEALILQLVAALALGLVAARLHRGHAFISHPPA